MISSSPIAITGMAWSTALGDDLDAVWQRLLACETGLAPVPHTPRLRNSLGAACASPSLDLPAAERMTAIGVPTLRRALADAGRDAAGAHMVLGTSLGAFLEGEPDSAPLNKWADTIAAAVGAAPPVSLSTACSSGSDAILVGAELIRAGVTDWVICGGVDVLTITKRLAHSSLGSMSPTTLRTFDERHDGTLLGEGAGFVILETTDAAAARGKKPLALLRGVGSANDAAGMTTPDAAGLGARYALERSLADAGIGAGEIAVINAHGSGTPLNDATEAMAFRDVFGGKGNPIVFGTKGNFGHSLGATGTIEAIAVLLALRTQKVPPVYGLEQPYPALTFPVPQGEPLACEGRYGLSLTLGFGGFDTSLVFEVVR
ncbi:MAG: beta-ketoacyl synthase N-terminal-like domain-containing protein [Minicystis sp.]